MSLSLVESNDLYYVETGKWTTAVDVNCSQGLQNFLDNMMKNVDSHSSASGAPLAVYNGYPQEDTLYPLLTGHTGHTGFHTRVPTGYSIVLYKNRQETWAFPELMTFLVGEDQLSGLPELGQKIGQHLLDSLLSKSLDKLGTAIATAGLSRGQLWLIPAGALVKWAPNIIDFGKKMLDILHAMPPESGVVRGGAIGSKRLNWQAFLWGETPPASAVDHKDLQPQGGRGQQLQEYYRVAQLWCMGMELPLGTGDVFLPQQENQFQGIMDAFNDVMRMIVLAATDEATASAIDKVFGNDTLASPSANWLSDSLLTSIKSEACKRTFAWLEEEVQKNTVNIYNQHQLEIDYDKLGDTLIKTMDKYLLLPGHGGVEYNLADVTGYSYFTTIMEGNEI